MFDVFDYIYIYMYIPPYSLISPPPYYAYGIISPLNDNNLRYDGVLALETGDKGSNRQRTTIY